MTDKNTYWGGNIFGTQVAKVRPEKSFVKFRSTRLLPHFLCSLIKPVYVRRPLMNSDRFRVSLEFYGGWKMRFERFPICFAVLVAMCLMTAPMFGQSLSSGDIAGTVADSSHAVVSNAKVVLKSLDTGSTQTAVTSSTGLYRFSLLKPGNYKVTVNQSGFSPVEISRTV